MPIRPKAEVEARRAAAQALAAIPPVSPAPPTEEPLPAASQSTRRPPRRRGHATKDINGKWQPAGDYAEGFCRPPERTRFVKGGKPGPGRPKGSVSQDALLRRYFDLKKRVRINGREKNLSHRELVIVREIMAAIEDKDRDARKFVLTESARLYTAASDLADAQTTETGVNASDKLTVEEFLSDLRAEIRAELEDEIARKARGEG